MFKNQLPISLVLLLSLTGGTLARFLQPTTVTANTTGPLLISPAPLQSAVAYNQTLGCGECVVGGYVFCINGPENYTGMAPLPTVCCKNATNCSQARNTSWSCSSKYQALTIVDQLRVCPFNVTQCGAQNVNFDNAGESQCVRLPTIQKGTACLYNVQSKCSVPNFKVNDTSSSIYTASIMLSNTTIPPVPLMNAAPSCFQVINQQCTCQPSFAANMSQLTCNCATVFNQTFNNSACACKSLTDALGNTLQSCTCGVPKPIQVYQDQQCQCQTAWNSTKGASYLNCTGCGATPSQASAFDPSVCNCLPAFDAVANRTYQSCVCLGVAQCPNPSSFPVQPKPVLAAAPCQTSYPCSCAATPSGALSCNCTNPSTQMKAAISQNASSCSCQINLNSDNKTWAQQCSCCLPSEFVRTKLIPAVTCPDSSYIKEQCQCLNATISNSSVTSLSCSCMNPTSNVIASGLTYSGASQCDCSDILLGSKSCNCCVPQTVQVQQLQPVCQANTTTQSCQCASTVNSTNQSCTCQNKQNGLSFANMVVNPKNCYCNSAKACNCCVSTAQFQQVKPICPASQPVTSCNCVGNSCSCPNSYFFNTTAQNVTLNQCACYPSANPNITSQVCQCCAGVSDLVAVPTCSATQSSVACTQCSYNSTTKNVACNCNGASVFDMMSPVSLTNMTFNSATQCGCINQAGSTSCQCCADNQLWQTALPACNLATATSEKCMCQNVSTNYQQNFTYVNTVNVTKNVVCRKTGCSGQICSQQNVNTTCTWMNQFACYSNAQCQYLPSTGDCGWVSSLTLGACLANPPQASAAVYQNITNRTVTNTTVVTPTNFTTVVTKNLTNYTWTCNCSNSRYPQYNMTNPPVDGAHCGCANSNNSVKSCSCCVSRTFEDQLYLSKEVCNANQSLSTCQCSNNMNCNCQVANSNTAYTGLSVNSSSCLCVNNTPSQQVCSCCLGQQATLIPKAPQCSASAPAQSCQCSGVFTPSTGLNNLQCGCNNTVVSNVTTSFNGTNTTKATSITYFTNALLTTPNCNCLNISTGASSKNLCNCCFQQPLACPVNSSSTIESCSCDSTLNCSCTRPDNSIQGSFKFNQSLCQCNPADASCKCCVSPAQVSTQVPVLTCAASFQKQNCSCANSSSLSCGCTRPDNGIKGTFTFNNSQCLCAANSSNCSCCVSTAQVVTQIPRKVCTTYGQGYSAQYCPCSNITFNTTSFNATSNKTVNVSNTVLNCQCTMPQFLITQSFNFTQSQCLCGVTGNSSCECCLSQSQTNAQIPSLQCPATSTPQVGCSCTNTVNMPANKVTSACTCPITYQGKQYTVANLTTQNSQCMTNTTTSGCCLTLAQIYAATEVQCSASQYRTVCNSCVGVFNNKTNTTLTSNCSSCATVTPNFIVNNQFYNNITNTSCLCRAPGSNCTCCVGSAPAAPAQPICNAAQQPLTNSCMCSPSVNGSQTCDCSQTNGTIVQQFTGLNISNCTCQNVQRPNGKQPFQCSCCAPTAQLAIAPPTCSQGSSSQQCNCLNQTDAFGRPNFNCSCTYGSTPVATQILTPSMCGCPMNNANVKKCSCCVAQSQYINAITPTCSAAVPNVTCACQPNGLCNCTGNLKSAPGQSITNYNLQVNQNQCGCYNNTQGNLTCNCCLNETALTQIVPKTCSAGQIPATCQCPSSNGTSRNCSCTTSSTGIQYFMNQVQLQRSACNCYDQVVNGVPSQQCSCCQSNSTLVITPPTCNLTSTTSQQCMCANVNGQNTCNCTAKVGNIQQTRNSVQIPPSQCQCLNQTVSGQNANNCTCCTPNPPPTLCQQLAVPSPTNLGCKCAYVAINGVSTFSCNCSSQVNATMTITRNNMAMNQSSCCCVQKTDPISKNGFMSCNCTQPAIPIPTNCICSPNPKNNSNAICTCSDCNNQIVPSAVLPVSQCSCPSSYFSYKPYVAPTPPAVNTTGNATQNGTKPATNGTNGTNGTNATKPANGTVPPTNATGNSSAGNATRPNSTNTSTPVVPPMNSTNTTRPNATANATNTTAGSPNVTQNSTHSNGTGNATTNGSAPSNVIGNASHPNQTTGNQSASNSTANASHSNQTVNTSAPSNVTNGTRPNSTSNSSTPSNVTNATHSNQTANTSTPQNMTNVTHSNQTTNVTNVTHSNQTTNSSVPSNVTNGTHANQSSNASSPSNSTNGTRPNATTNSSTPSNVTNATHSNQTTNSSSPANVTTNGTRLNSTTNSSITSNATRANQTTNSSSSNATNATNVTHSNATQNTSVPSNATNGTRANSTTNSSAPSNATNATRSNQTTNTSQPSNMTNGTHTNQSSNASAPSNATNGTRPNSTTNSSTPANMTNVTHSNQSSNASVSSNVTNATHANQTQNASAPSNATNSTRQNQTQSNATSQPSNATNGTKLNATAGNGSSNATNATRPNSTSAGNSSAPQNATNVTHQNQTQNGSAPSNATNGNRTNQTQSNSTVPPANSTNGTRPNSTQSNGSAQSNMTGNATMPPNNATNGSRPNQTQGNGSVPTNGTTPPPKQNSTSNSSNTSPVPPPLMTGQFMCNCQIQFAGLCQPLNVSAPLDEHQCDVSNVPAPVQPINAGCKYQYSYLVAVVATGKDSSLLMQLQSYQMQNFGQYLSLSFASLFVLAAAFLFY